MKNYHQLTSTTDDNLEQYLEALDEKRVHGRVQLLSRLGPEVYDDLLEYRLHLRTLQHQSVWTGRCVRVSYGIRGNGAGRRTMGLSRINPQTAIQPLTHEHIKRLEKYNSTTAKYVASDFIPTSTKPHTPTQPNISHIKLAGVFYLAERRRRQRRRRR